MSLLLTQYRAASLVLCATLAACTTLQPVPYSGLASSSQMRPNPRDSTGRIPFAYSADIDWRKYTAAIVEPVVVYREADAQFENISEEDKANLARYMKTQFTEALSTRFRRASVAGDDTLRIKITLTGAKANTNVLNTVMHFDLLGGPYNAVQAVRDKEGMMSGSVSFAVEIHDSSTHELLGAYVAKQFPNAWNLPAGMGSMAAAEVGVKKGADQLVAHLR